MVNEFTPDFFHYNILEELLSWSKKCPEGVTYSLLFRKVEENRKDRYGLTTPTPSFSRKLKELQENNYIEIVRSHPRTFIKLKCLEVERLVTSYMEVRKYSLKESLIKNNKEVIREHKK